jgi:uncharacterized protein
MKIVWDEPKRVANIAKRGRQAAIGRLDGVIAVIFAMLGTEGVSIISARPANRKERQLLNDHETIH